MPPCLRIKTVVYLGSCLTAQAEPVFRHERRWVYRSALVVKPVSRHRPALRTVFGLPSVVGYRFVLILFVPEEELAVREAQRNAVAQFESEPFVPLDTFPNSTTRRVELTSSAVSQSVFHSAPFHDSSFMSSTTCS